MPEMFFLSAPDPVQVRELQGSLGTERVLWSGRCAVAEYAFEEPASLPRWTLPEETEVVVTETRVTFVDPSGQAGGELHWPWPQHLRVQPGNRDTGRSATVTQIQLVCSGPGESFPALVFAGGDLSTVGDADKLANVLRQSIARFRVEYSTDLGLTAPQARMLSRLVIGPEFSNYQGGEGQTVSLLGAIVVDQPVSAAAPRELETVPQQSWEPDPFLDDYLPPSGYPVERSYQDAEYAPHPYADYLDQHPASPAGWVEEIPTAYPVPLESIRPAPLEAIRPAPLASIRAAQPEHADLESRAADLAARVANLVSANAGLEPSLDRYEIQTTNLSSFLSGEDAPVDDYAPSDDYARSDFIRPEERAETIRRTAARFAGNSARARGTTGDYGTRQRHS